MKPRLLDLFCGAGGCSVGYARAGFDVVGVDIEPHPDYPFEFNQDDAMETLTWPDYLDTFDVVHASPPCPRYSVAGSIGSYNPDDKPDLVGPVREALTAWGGMWVIENVPGAPMPDAVTICGWAMGLKQIRRHRLFESNTLLMSPGCACPNTPSVSVFGHASDLYVDGVRTHVPLPEVKALMGVEWMTSRDDVSDSIPPAYTEYIGAQLIDALDVAA